MLKDCQPFIFPALRVHQGPNRVLYSFAVDGKLIPEFASVPNIRLQDGRVNGYQRTEIVGHVNEIKGYLHSDDPMIPNNIVIAFDKNVDFVPKDVGSSETLTGCFGDIVIPNYGASNVTSKPGQVVDGQQRIAAIRESDLTSFPMFVTAFIAVDEADQRGQFLLVNSAKPLPKPLVNELLPDTEVRLPAVLRRKRYPTLLMQRLNTDFDSPLLGKIRTPTTPNGSIRDNSIIRSLEFSLADGVLHKFRDPITGNGDTEKILEILKCFWTAVSRIWPRDWELPPRNSRLLHGSGIITLGMLMDAIADRCDYLGYLDTDLFEADLEKLKPVCHWSEGSWEFSGGRIRGWSEIQNVVRDIEMLADHVLNEYKRLVWRPTFVL